MPPRAILAWCLSPDTPDPLEVSRALKQAQDAEQAVAALAAPSSRCARTAELARRMLWSLCTDEFVAFG